MYDVAIIGGGPGGYAAAIRVSQLGGRAVLIEGDTVGGTCVHRGCIPTKIWHRAARLIKDLAAGADFGVKARLEGLDMEALRSRIEGVSGDIRMGMEGLLENNGVTVIHGFGELKSPTEISVEGTTVAARNIILAAGSRPVFPDIPGLEDALLTTNQALALTRLPSSVLVLGSGPIQVEMATYLRVFGSTVRLVTPAPRILEAEDHDTSQRVAQGLRELGIEVLTRHGLAAVRRSGAAFEADLSGAKAAAVAVDRVLVGDRRARTEGMGLREVGVRLEEDGAVAVNDRLESSLSNVYAVGDCTGGWMLSHASSAMAIAAAENAMGRQVRFPFQRVPRAVWTLPEVGSVGLSEQEAETAGYEVETGSFPFSINGLAMARGEMEGEVKIVFEPRCGEILGVHMVGANATELVGEALLALQLECTVQEWAKGFRPHPTFSESVVDAARDAVGWALYLPRRP